MFNITYQQYFNECGQLFITPNVKVSNQIFVFSDASFIEGEKLQNGGKPAMFIIFSFNGQIILHFMNKNRTV